MWTCVYTHTHIFILGLFLDLLFLFIGLLLVLEFKNTNAQLLPPPHLQETDLIRPSVANFFQAPQVTLTYSQSWKPLLSMFDFYAWV